MLRTALREDSTIYAATTKKINIELTAMFIEWTRLVVSNEHRPPGSLEEVAGMCALKGLKG